MSVESRRIGIIRELLGRSSIPSLRPIHGVDAHDDCALVNLSDDIDLVVGSDFVRGAGFYLFKLGLLSWSDIGFYLVGANVSDLAAMGAQPLGIATVCRYTSDITDENFRDLMSGIVSACSEFGVPLVGGDTGSYETSVLSAAAFGTCRPGAALLRRGGRPGDRLFLSGDVGLAAAAIAYFLRAKPDGMSLSSDEEEILLKRWRRVKPALNQGRLLTARGLSRCGIDTSDGLKAACRQLAEASRVDIVVEAGSVPVHQLVRTVAQFLKVDPLALAVGDSVDFRLLFSSSASVQSEFEANGWELYQIGEMTESVGTPTVRCRSEGTLSEMPGFEWAQSDDLTIDLLRGRSTL